jgi:glycosyltransferase involved in cell wall biosynthesis
MAWRKPLNQPLLFMKILAVNKFYYLYGGADRFFLDTNELLRRKGHEVIPFAMSHEKNLSTPYAGYFVSPIHFFDAKRRSRPWKIVGRVLYSLEAKRKISSLLKKTRPDLAHLHNIAHQLSPSILQPLKALGLPVVQTLHDYKLICPTYSLLSKGELCERCKGGRFYHAALERCNRGSLAASALNSVEMYLHHAVLKLYDQVDRFIAVSRFLRTKIIEFGVAPERVVHIPNFVDLDAWSPKKERGEYIVYFGRLVEMKGLSTLIRAMKHVKKVNLLVIGEGDLKDRLLAEADSEGLSHVRFLGYRSGTELASLVGQGLFTIVPSEWYEPSPQTIKESFAAGRPVIGARIGGIPELIEDGVDGVLFTPGNSEDLAEKIDSMLRNRSRLEAMGAAARKKAEEQFHPDRHYEGLMNLYRSLGGPVG